MKKNKKVKESEWLEPEEVSVGMEGEDYNGDTYTVKAIYRINKITPIQLSSLKRFDESGWLYGDVKGIKSEEFAEENGYDHSDWLDSWLVATNDAVYIYGDGGFLVPATERWKNSKKLKSLSDKTGVLENASVDDWMRPQEVKPGMVGVDYDDEHATVIMIFKIANINEFRLKNYLNTMTLDGCLTT